MQGVKIYVKEVLDKAKGIRHRLIITSLAYYLVLAIVPTVTLVIFLCSIFIDDIQPIIYVLDNFIDENIARQIIGFVLNRDISSNSILITTWIGSLWIMSNGTNMLIQAMNDMYGIDNKPFIITRVKALVLAVMILLIISITIILITVLPIVFSYFNLGLVWDTFQYPIYALFVCIATACIYKTGPSMTVPLYSVVNGSMFSGVGLLIIVAGFKTYLNTSFANFDNVYGPIASFAVMLIMFYFISHVIYIGLCMNVLYYEKNIAYIEESDCK